MKHIFLINPAAGSRGRQAELAGVCRKAALEQNLEYEILVTEHPGHGVELVRKACLQGGGQHLRFYACGGDGTLNEAARGAFGMWNVAVGHFPAGTGNDFIKVFGRQMNRFFQLPELTKGEELPVDYVETNCGGAVNVLSVGIDARVAAGMRKYKRLPLCRGQWPYVFSAAENIVRGLGWQELRWRLFHDLRRQWPVVWRRLLPCARCGPSGWAAGCASGEQSGPYDGGQGGRGL